MFLGSAKWVLLFENNIGVKKTLEKILSDLNCFSPSVGFCFLIVFAFHGNLPIGE